MTTDDPVDLDAETPHGRGARNEGDDVERLSLHGPTFEEVMAALLAVDPRNTNPDKGADDGSKG